jgi:transposase
MIRIHLSDPEVQRLEQVFRTTPDAILRHRVHIVLMAHRGRHHPTIAQDTGTSQRSVQRWLKAYRDRGLDGLQPRKAKGATPKLTAAVAPLLRQWVLDGPAACGLERANWTYVELADHLWKTQGIQIRTSALQAFWRQHGIRPYRPTYRCLRGDPGKQAQAREDLAVLKKKPRRARACS